MGIMLGADPFNDEFAAGHAGRLMRLNGKDSIKELIATLDQLHNPNRGKWQPESAHRLVADLIGMSAEAYVAQHTILPFTHVAAKTSNDLSQFDQSAFKIPNLAFRPGREGAHFCSQCARNDYESMRLSYWRRLHQLPGIDVCEVHEIPLSYVERSDAFEFQPHTFISSSKSVDISIAELARSDPAIRRYQAIANNFLTTAKRISRFDASACLSPRAQSLGLRINARGSDRTMTMHIRETFPQAWTFKHFPSVVGRRNCGQYATIDGVCRSQLSPGWAYAMCLASAFDDADGAVADFYLTSCDRLENPIEKLRMEKLKQGRRLALPEYVEHQGNHSRMAKAQCKSEVTIYKKLKRLGLPSLTFLEKGKRNQLLEFLRKASFERVNEWAEKMRALIITDKRAASCHKTWEREGMFSF